MSGPQAPGFRRTGTRKAEVAAAQAPTAGSTKATTYTLIEKPSARPVEGCGVVSLPGRGVLVILPVPSGCDALLCLRLVSRTSKHLVGLLMLLALLWEGRFKDVKTMRLPKEMALRFVSDRLCGRGNNPTTVVCTALGCSPVEKGSNLHGSVTNIWSYPANADGGTQRLEIWLTPYQFRRWENRREILLKCQERRHPVVVVLRDTLSVTTESDRFKVIAAELEKSGEKRAVSSWRKTPAKVSITRDGDVLSAVARLPAVLRRELMVDGLPVVELDIKSAHAVLLGMFYEGESEPHWIEERKRYHLEAARGFTLFYGHAKQHKKAFLAALNQSPNAARHASMGYANLEMVFPLLAAKLADLRSTRPKALGNILRSKLARIMTNAVQRIHEAGHRCIPVTDSLLIPNFDTDEKARIETELWIQKIGDDITNLSGIRPLIRSKG